MTTPTRDFSDPEIDELLGNPDEPIEVTIPGTFDTPSDFNRAIAAKLNFTDSEFTDGSLATYHAERDMNGVLVKVIGIAEFFNTDADEKLALLSGPLIEVHGDQVYWHLDELREISEDEATKISAGW